MPIAHVTDPADPRLADYAGLRDPRHRRRVETAQPPGFFVAEGATVVRRLLASPLAVRSVLVTPARLEAMAPHVPPGVTLLVVAGDVLAAVAGFDVHRGILAAADRPFPPRLHEVLSRAHRVAVLEGINDHENMGAVLRSAAGLGMDAVVHDPTCCDPWYRRSVRVSMGGVFAIPIVPAADWSGALVELKDHGFALVAMTPDPAASDLAAVDVPARCAVLLGAEGPGLSPAALAAADTHARIPMASGLDSLNVAHAAAIAFWATRR